MSAMSEGSLDDFGAQAPKPGDWIKIKVWYESNTTFHDVARQPERRIELVAREIADELNAGIWDYYGLVPADGMKDEVETSAGLIENELYELITDDNLTEEDEEELWKAVDAVASKHEPWNEDDEDDN